MDLMYDVEQLHTRQAKRHFDQITQTADAWVQMLLAQQLKGNLLGTVVLNHRLTEVEQAVINLFNNGRHKHREWTVSWRRGGWLWRKRIVSFRVRPGHLPADTRRAALAPPADRGNDQAPTRTAKPRQSDVAPKVAGIEMVIQDVLHTRSSI